MLYDASGFQDKAEYNNHKTYNSWSSAWGGHPNEGQTHQHLQQQDSCYRERHRSQELCRPKDSRSSNLEELLIYKYGYAILTPEDLM